MCPPVSRKSSFLSARPVAFACLTVQQNNSKLKFVLITVVIKFQMFYLLQTQRMTAMAKRRNVNMPTIVKMMPRLPLGATVGLGALFDSSFSSISV